SGSLSQDAALVIKAAPTARLYTTETKSFRTFTQPLRSLDSGFPRASPTFIPFADGRGDTRRSAFHVEKDCPDFLIGRADRPFRRASRRRERRRRRRPGRLVHFRHGDPRPCRPSSFLPFRPRACAVGSQPSFWLSGKVRLPRACVARWRGRWPQRRLRR